MANRNYLKGRRHEYAVAKSLRELGYTYVTRAAGSHSPFDIIAVNPNTKKILLVQCKTSAKEREKVKALTEMSGEYDVTVKIL